MTEPARKTLTDWVEQLQSAGMPIFSRTVSEVSGVAESRQSSARDLSVAIGRDASLSARLLKIANSPLFNLQNRTIDTISAAVVMIGFDAVRELAVSLALIEQVLKGRRHARLTQTMSRAFHAAAQARSFAAALHDRRPEEVFVAALLLRIGEMAFWAAAEEEAAAIERMTRTGASLADAEMRVLGFHLEDLTRRLVEEWKLGGLLENAVTGKPDPRVASVRLGDEVAAVVEQFGWDSAEARHTIESVARHLDQPRARVTELIEANVEEAGRIAGRYGVPAVQNYLLRHDHPEQRRTPDAAVQLDSLKRIAEHLEGDVDLGELVRLVLTGIHEGIGLERTFFALLSPDRSMLQVKHALGDCGTGAIALHESPRRDLFRAALTSGKLVHITEENRASVAALLTEHLTARVAVPFVAMPIRAGSRAVGLLYADNAPHGGVIGPESLSAFRHFGQQISLALGSRQG